MGIETKSIHITPAGGNVFADLGFESKEAAEMKAESQRIIFEKQAINDCLMTEMAGRAEAKKHGQTGVAENDRSEKA
ncbi:MAG: hypothetical protein PF483_02855 [Halothiobacillus sp.]|jgi:hypothetical protein|uniref:hypothetical protein n=1 Tax=Halothiobacillus sp. TaxID=1891311 RepID=UPI002AD46FD2|nr:hypothetical protein [Halothiobacillus sp.]MDA3876009.1 hypothetical protein [Halothiobacillus sp.]